jgi:hypothetical protein
MTFGQSVQFWIAREVAHVAIFAGIVGTLTAALALLWFVQLIARALRRLRPSARKPAKGVG